MWQPRGTASRLPWKRCLPREICAGGNPWWSGDSIYTHGIKNAEKFEGKLVEQNYRLKNRLQIGATIGTHVGGGAFGLIYVEK